MSKKTLYRLDILRTYFRDIEEGETKEAALELLKMVDKYSKELKDIRKHAVETTKKDTNNLVTLKDEEMSDTKWLYNGFSVSMGGGKVTMSMDAYYKLYDLARKSLDQYVCPYCGYIFHYSDTFAHDKGSIDCNDCGEIFNYRRRFFWIYETETIPPQPHHTFPIASSASDSHESK